MASVLVFSGMMFTLAWHYTPGKLIVLHNEHSGEGDSDYTIKTIIIKLIILVVKLTLVATEEECDLLKGRDTSLSIYHTRQLDYLRAYLSACSFAAC